MLHVLVLSVLGGYAAVMSDQVNLPATIPLYLCNRTLEFNTTVVLDDGEYLISSGPPCDISNKGNIAITGPLMKSAIIRCEGEGRIFRFSSVQRFNMERMTFINCDIHLESIENTFITNCTFQSSSMEAKSSHNNANIWITNCAFNDGSRADIDMWYGNYNLSILNCTFQNNCVTDDGGAVVLVASAININITNCTFQNNSATSGGAVKLEGLKGDVSITNCSFQNNSAIIGGALDYSFDEKANVSITNCSFQKNSATYGGGAVYSFESKGDTSITNCTFQNNRASFAGGALWMSESMVNVTITDCTFQNNNATNGGASIIFPLSAFIYNSTFTNSTAVTGAAVHARNGINSQVEPLGHLLLQDVVIKDNHCSRGGAICFDGLKVDIFGNSPTGSQFSSNSPKGAVQGQNGILLLHGNITFTENRGVNGGAISLS